MVPVAIAWEGESLSWTGDASFVPHYLQMAARERMFEALHPRTGPPPPKWVHVPPRSERDPGTKPLPTIAEAMAALSGRRGPG